MDSLIRAISPEEWPHTTAAQEHINQPGNGSGKEVIQFGVVQHPTQPICYFATKSAIYLPPPADTGDLFTAIYRYNTSDGSWERLFKRQSEYNFDRTPEDSLETYYVLGYDNERLVVQILRQAAPENKKELWDVPFTEGVNSEGNKIVLVSGPVAIDLAQPYAKRPPYEQPAQ